MQGIGIVLLLQTLYLVDIPLVLHDVLIMMSIMSYSLVQLLSLSDPKLVF